MKTKQKQQLMQNIAQTYGWQNVKKKYQKDDIIEVENKYGNINESIVHNLVYKKDGYFFYSITC